MSQSEARAWWADVEEVRATIERRRDAERRIAEDGRGPDAFSEIDDLAVRRRFRGRERMAADAAADVWFDEPAAGGRSAEGRPRSAAGRPASRPSRQSPPPPPPRAAPPRPAPPPGPRRPPHLRPAHRAPRPRHRRTAGPR